ncbi:MAG: hypothetical protein ACAI44_38235 [Candidatus Sericytochromatia bacterium]
MMEKYRSESEQELCQLLIQLDLLTREQVNEAFLYQCRLPNSEAMSIEDIMVEMELISPNMLEQVKSMFHQATQLYGRTNSRPLALTAPQQAPAMLKRGNDDRSVLQPMRKPLRTQEVSICKTSELRLSPELQAVIKGVVPAANASTCQFSQQAQPSPECKPAEPDLMAFDALDAVRPLDPHKTLIILPYNQNDEASETDSGPGSATLEAAPEPVTALEPVAVFPQSTVPKTQPLSEINPPLSLPDMTAKPSQNSLPQLGEILLNNHELEEWQLMHALCIQKEAPQVMPRIGTLLIKLGYVNRQTIERALSIQLAEELKGENRLVS